MAVVSRHLDARQQRGLNKLGDACLGGDGEFPPFSTLGCGEHVDELLDFMPDQDRRDVKLLLNLCGHLPRFCLTWLLTLLEWSQRLPGPPGAALRFMRMGTKGLVLTLYYSGRKGSQYAGRTPLEILGYQVSVWTADVDAAEAAAAARHAPLGQASQKSLS